MDATVIPSDTPSIFDVLASLTALQQQAIVRPNNPPPGIAGFLFDIPLGESIELTSNITDHYVEDNTAIQDQIALSPEQITVRGLVAELSDGRSEVPQLAPTPDPLPLNEPLVPNITTQAQQTQDAQLAIVDSSATAVTSQQSLYGYFNAQSAQQPNQTKQTKAFLYFYNLYKGRMRFSVDTPWGTMTNVAILSMRAEQSEDSKYVSELRITFKKIRVAGELVIATGQLAGRSALQAAPITRNGNAGELPQTQAQKESILYQMLTPSP